MKITLAASNSRPKISREGVPNYDHPLITTKKIRWRLTSPGNVTIDVLALLRVLLRIKRLTKKRKAVLRKIALFLELNKTERGRLSNFDLEGTRHTSWHQVLFIQRLLPQYEYINGFR